MGRWAVIRTNRTAARGQMLSLPLKCAAGTAVICFVLCHMALGLSALIPAPAASSGTFGVSGFILLVATILFLPAQIVIVPLAAVLLWSGYAGWLVSLGVGVLMCIAAIWRLEQNWHTLLQDLPFSGLTGLVFGAVYWLAGVIFAPDVFRKTTP